MTDAAERDAPAARAGCFIVGRQFESPRKLIPVVDDARRPRVHGRWRDLRTIRSPIAPGNERGRASRRDPSKHLAPRPGLEPGTCGLTGQGRAGRGATNPKKRNGFSGGEGRGRDAPNPLRAGALGVPRPAGRTSKRNNGLRDRRPNRGRTAADRFRCRPVLLSATNGHRSPLANLPGS